MTVLTATADGPLLTVKGAPEVVLARCAPGPEVDRLAAAVPELARRGLRVLALATSGRPGGTDLAELPELDAAGLTPAGLVALSDEIRPSARSAVADCRAAGIRVVMVTGDHADTARAVAAEVGIQAEPVITGATLDGATLDGAALDGAALDGATLDDATLDGAALDSAGRESAGPAQQRGPQGAGPARAGKDGAAGPRCCAGPGCWPGSIRPPNSSWCARCAPAARSSP
nr:hypothetical protein GCM10020093_019430 [Planobispora longispora]